MNVVCKEMHTACQRPHLHNSPLYNINYFVYLNEGTWFFFFFNTLYFFIKLKPN